RRRGLRGDRRDGGRAPVLPHRRALVHRRGNAALARRAALRARRGRARALRRRERRGAAPPRLRARAGRGAEARLPRALPLEAAPRRRARAPRARVRRLARGAAPARLRRRVAPRDHALMSASGAEREARALGLVAGRGALPLAVARAARRRGRRIAAVGFAGETDAALAACVDSLAWL